MTTFTKAGLGWIGNRLMGPTGGELDLPLIAWEGGPDYWTVAQEGAKMTKAEAAGWSDPSFFPIGVFLPPTDSTARSVYSSVGMNTFLSCHHNTGDLAAVTAEFFLLAQYDEWTTGEIGSNGNVVAWSWDEPEFTIGNTVWKSQIDTARARADGRFMWTNWGAAPILEWEFDFTYADVIGIDQYAYTSTTVRDHFHSPGGGGVSPGWPGPAGDDDYAEKAATYGFIADRTYAVQGGTPIQPGWVFVETKMPYLGPNVGDEPGKDIILYDEIEGAVWAAIIHEARGIQWFDYNGFYNADAPAIDPNTGLAPDTGDPAIINCEPEVFDIVQQVNTKVTSLASVINTQSFEFDFGASGVDTMLKGTGGFAYIFAGVGLGGTTGSKTFTVTGSGITGTNVEVVDESRSLTISSGQFTDTFANEYTHHVYKVAI